MNHTFWLERASTPLGELLLLSDTEGRLRALDWGDYEARMYELLRKQYAGDKVELRERASSSPSPSLLAMQAYFAGQLDAVDALAVATGGTTFQREVWLALRSIPCGSTLSYGALAARIGKPAAVRAVGLANGQNPISVVLPCHRVVGAKGALTGYAGGLARKRWLLEHEQRWSIGK